MIWSCKSSVNEPTAGCRPIARLALLLCAWGAWDMSDQLQWLKDIQAIIAGMIDVLGRRPLSANAGEGFDLLCRYLHDESEEMAVPLRVRAMVARDKPKLRQASVSKYLKRP